MKSHAAKAMEQPHTVNTVTKLWQKLGCNVMLLNKLSEYIKLAQIATTVVLGSCEDERTFSTLLFVKSKVKIACREIWTPPFGCSTKVGTLSNPSLTTKLMISRRNKKT
jgi:hypothetical protein